MTGTWTSNRFTTYDMAELSVSKGFASVLYGPNALGGAINIVSKRPSAPFQGQATAGYGSGASRIVSINAGSRLRSLYLQGGATYLDADAFPLPGAFAATKNQPAGDRLNAYRQDSKLSLKLGWTPNGRDEYTVSYVGQRAEKGNPPYAGVDPSVKVRYWQWPYWNKDSVYVVSNTRLGASSYVRGRAFYDTYDNALYSYDDATYTTMAKASSFRSLYRDDTVGGSGEWGASLGRHNLRAAGHYKGDAHEDHNLGEPVKHFQGRIVSLGVQDSWTIGPTLSLAAGISGDWQASSRGVELDSRTWLLPRLDLGANCTFLNRENISDPSVPLINAPRHKGRAAVTATVARWMRVVAGIDVEAGRRTQNEGGTYFDVPSFATTNIRAAATIRRGIEAEVSVLNAFDKYYWVSEGYPGMGRTVLASLRYAY